MTGPCAAASEMTPPPADVQRPRVHVRLDAPPRPRPRSRRASRRRRRCARDRSSAPRAPVVERRQVRVRPEELHERHGVERGLPELVAQREEVLQAAEEVEAAAALALEEIVDAVAALVRRAGRARVVVRDVDAVLRRPRARAPNVTLSIATAIQPFERDAVGEREQVVARAVEAVLHDDDRDSPRRASARSGRRTSPRSSSSAPRAATTGSPAPSRAKVACSRSSYFPGRTRR